MDVMILLGPFYLGIFYDSMTSAGTQIREQMRCSPSPHLISEVQNKVVSQRQRGILLEKIIQMKSPIQKVPSLWITQALETRDTQYWL